MLTMVLQCTYVLVYFFIFNPKNDGSDWIILPLHYISTQFPRKMWSLSHLWMTLCTCYLPSCHNSFHTAVIF